MGGQASGAYPGGAPAGGQAPSGAKSTEDIKQGLKQATDAALKGLEMEKLQVKGLSGFFAQLFKHHTWDEVENLCCVGSPSTTPALTAIPTTWPTPWLFLRVAAVTLIAAFLLYWRAEDLGQTVIFPLLLTGIAGLQCAVMLLFWEMNAPRNISLIQVGKCIAVGGFLSIFFTLLFLKIFGEYENPIWAGPVEETMKLIALCFFAGNKRYSYKINGLILGAAVGTGFAILEDGYYFFATGAELVMWERALYSLVGHALFTALTGAAYWRVKELQIPLVNRIFSPKFLVPFIVGVGLHMFNNSSLLKDEFLLKIGIMFVVGYFFVLVLLQEGLKEIWMLQKNVEASQGVAARR
ncbi:MAG: PrsW family intramembrane metalloprotease [Oligosphaeraceae bacterium]